VVAKQQKKQTENQRLQRKMRQVNAEKENEGWTNQIPTLKMEKVA